MPRLSAPDTSFPWYKTGMNPQLPHTDHVLAKIHATGGDIRRVCDLFGIGIEDAIRYVTTLDHPVFRGEVPHHRRRILCLPRSRDDVSAVG